MVSEYFQYKTQKQNKTPTVASDSAEMHGCVIFPTASMSLIHGMYNLTQSIQGNKLMWCQLKGKTGPDRLKPGRRV